MKTDQKIIKELLTANSSDEANKVFKLKKNSGKYRYTMKAFERLMMVFFAMVIFSNYCLSQNMDSSNTFVLEAKTSAQSSYDKFIEDQLGIFNGPEYINHDIGIKGHPFFMADYFEVGSICFDEIVYHDIPIKYDIVKNKVLIEYFDYNRYSKELVLENDKIRYFEYEGHNFVNVNSHNPIGTLKDGFYDHIFDGEIDIYVKRKKELYEKTRNLQLLKSFVIIDSYFVIVANNTHRVQGKSSLLKVYADQKKELKKYIKENFLDFKLNFEASLLSVTEQYIKLKQQNEIN